MGHDASKVLMGATQSTFKHVDNAAGTVAAGKVVVRGSTGAISTTLSAGSIIGVSLGNDLSDTARTAICRKGVLVPILIDAFSPVIGAQVQVHATSGLAVASGTAVNAIYASGALTGLLEDGTTASVALIDMPGGL